MQTCLKQKNINLGGNIQIKFQLQHYISCIKIFKIRPHLTIFGEFYLENIFYKAPTHGLLRTNAYLFVNKILNPTNN